MNNKPIFKQLTKEEINKKEIAKLKKDVDFLEKKIRDVEGETGRIDERVHDINTVLYNQKRQEEIKQHKKAERQETVEILICLIIIGLAIVGLVTLTSMIWR